MIRIPFVIAFLLCAPLAPASGAERALALTAFDRVRVDGPIAVRVATGREPGGRIVGEPAAMDGLVLRVEGGTLLIRPAARNRDERSFAAGPGPLPVVEIGTRALRSVAVTGGGQVAIDGPVRGDRIDLTITGTGAIAAPALATDALVVTLVGDGTLTLGGTVRSARLIANGGGVIAAGDLTAGDALIRTEGPVAVTLTGRYTVSAGSTGSGQITILGNPECKVRVNGAGTIACHNQTRF